MEDEPLDPALLARLVRLETATGDTVAGTAEATADGRRWRLVPAAPWRPGRYRLVVDPALEDLAGNRVDRAFEAVSSEGPRVAPTASGAPRVREVTIPDAL